MLYIVATPIGNLDDISQRALATLRQVDLIASEDTRTTRKLLSRFDITVKLISYFQHSDSSKLKSIIAKLEEGKDIALVSEAGTPAISDPGGKLVAAAVEAEIKVSPIPGPSALVAAASISGLPTDSFVFYGFLPRKQGRQGKFREMLAEEKTVIFYESPHRIVKTLTELTELAEEEYQAVVCRELTKKFEEIIRGSLISVTEDLATRESIKGEFVVVLKVSSKK